MLMMFFTGTYISKGCVVIPKRCCGVNFSNWSELKNNVSVTFSSKASTRRYLGQENIRSKRLCNLLLIMKDAIESKMLA